MAAPEPSQPIPLADLVAFLESRRIRVTPREYLRLRTLLAAAGPWTRPRLADAIAALMASRRSELLSLRHELRAYLEVAAASTSESEELKVDDIDLALVEQELGSLSPGPALSPPKPLIALDVRHRIAAAGLGVAGLLVLAVALLSAVPKADEVKTLYAEPATIDVRSNDRLPRLGPASVVLTQPPRRGTAKVLPDGQVLYTPEPSFSETDSFRYALESWRGARSARVTVTVEPAPLPELSEPPEPIPGEAFPSPRMRIYRNAHQIGQITAYPGRPSGVPWLEIFSSLGLLAFAITASLYFRSRHRIERLEPLEWNQDHDSEERYRPGTVGGDPQPWLDSATLNRLSQLPLYRALDEPSGRLDLDATAKASARGVRPELVFERRRETLTVLLLVDENAAPLAWNRVVWDLARGLRARGVPVEIAFFRGGLADIFERTPGRLHLPDLEDERWRHAVLVVSDGKGLRREDIKHLESLAAWPHAVWLDVRETRFWDDSVKPASEAGLPLFPADAEGLLAAFDALLSDKGRHERSSTLEQLRRHGGLARGRTSLRGQLIEILAGAAPWAQACAMIQPVPLPLAELLRRRFFPEQPPVAIGRLVALPETRLSVAGLTFSPSVLALLRHDFATRLSEEEQEAVLALLLEEVDKTEPRRQGELPDIAHLEWQAHRERLRLESAPDAALAQLARLATTPVGPTIELALGPVVLPGRGRPSRGVGDYARIPLRRAPTTAVARQVLARFAVDSGIEARERLPWRAVEKAAVLLLAAGSLVLGGVAVTRWLAAPPDPGWTMQLKLPGGTTSDRLTIQNASFSLLEIDATTGRATAARQDVDARSAPLRPVPGLQPGRSYRAFLMSGGILDGRELPPLKGPNGRVELEIEQHTTAQPCTQANADSGLVRDVCPPGFEDAVVISSWREQVRDKGRDNWISIGIEIAGRDEASEAATDLRTALLATGAVDRVYRIDVAGPDSVQRARSSFQTILDELAPYDTHAQILFWPAAGILTPSSSSLPALAATADAGDGERLTASQVPLFTPRGLVLPAIVGTSWIARFQEAVSQRDSPIVLPDGFFERLAAEVANQTVVEPPPPEPALPIERSFTILSLANTTRIEGLSRGTIGGLARVLDLRRRLEEKDPNLLVLHAGGILFPSLLSRKFQGAQMIEALNLLDGAPEGFDDRLVVNIGNHELDGDRRPGTSTLEKRIEESQFRWTSLNFSKLRQLQRQAGDPPDIMVKIHGIDVGIFGLLTPDPPRVGKPARSPSEMTRSLRKRGAQVVIALSHQTYAENLALLNGSPASDVPDLILGGQEHLRVEREVAGRWLLIPEAEAAGVHVTKVGLTAEGKVAIEPSYVKLQEDDPSGDPQELLLAYRWYEQYGRNGPVGRTLTTLHGTEEAIRSEETNLGDWVADQMLAAFADRGAQVAFINAGALRLNDDILQGELLDRDLDALLPYPTPLVLLRLRGSTLQEVMRHAVSAWPGSGHWLQVAGMTFRLDRETRSASGLSRLVSTDGGRTLTSVDLAPDEEILAVTPSYLVDPANGDQDGYAMLDPSQIVAEGPDLREVLEQALRQAPDGIAPKAEGRICIGGSLGPCLVRDEEPAPRLLSVSGSLGNIRPNPDCGPLDPDRLCWETEPGLEVYWSKDESERKWSGPFLTNSKGEFSFTAEPGPLLLRAYKRHPLWRTLLWERRTNAGSRLESEEITRDPPYEPFTEVGDYPGPAFKNPFQQTEVVLGLKVPDSAAAEIDEVLYAFFDGAGRTLLRADNSGAEFRVSYRYEGDRCLGTVTITVTYKNASTRPLIIEFDHCAAVRRLP